MPKIINHDLRREEIADVVMKLISEEGIEKATVRAICRRGGFSTGVIAHYFHNQEDLLTYVFEWHIEKIRARLQMMVDHMQAGVDDQLESLLNTLLPGGIGHDPVDDGQFSLGLWSFMSSKPELEEKLRVSYKSLIDLVAQAIQRSTDLTRAEAKSNAAFTMSAIDGIWMHYNLGMINNKQLRRMAHQLRSTVLPRATATVPFKKVQLN